MPIVRWRPSLPISRSWRLASRTAIPQLRDLSPCPAPIGPVIYLTVHFDPFGGQPGGRVGWPPADSPDAVRLPPVPVYLTTLVCVTLWRQVRGTGPSGRRAIQVQIIPVMRPRRRAPFVAMAVQCAALGCTRQYQFQAREEMR